MTKKEKEVIFEKIAEYAEPAGYYCGRGMKDDANEMFQRLRVVKDVADALGFSREEIIETANAWTKIGERQGKAELAADEIDLSEFKSYEVYERTGNPEEPETLLLDTPYFIQAYIPYIRAEEAGKHNILIKCVRHDGTEIPYIGGTHEN